MVQPSCHAIPFGVLAHALKVTEITLDLEGHTRTVTAAFGSSGVQHTARMVQTWFSCSHVPVGPFLCQPKQLDRSHSHVIPTKKASHDASARVAI